MRPSHFLVAIGLLGLSSCHGTSPQEAQQTAPTGLLGRWKLVSRSGGMMPNPTLPQESLEFGADSTVRIYQNGQLLQQYRFRATTATDFCTNLPQPLRFVQFYVAGQPGGQTYAYQLQQNELVLDGNVCIDGTLSRYQPESAH